MPYSALELKSTTLLRLLQLASATLPVGAYSYSEGLEWWVQRDRITTADHLTHWLTQELQAGAIRLEGAVLVRAYQASQQADWAAVAHWNAWLTATRETAELRQQSWQMGRSLLRLWQDLAPDAPRPNLAATVEWNFAIAFGLVAADWDIPLAAALLGYLQSWVANQVSAGVKLIPLGQTAGQRLLLTLQSPVEQATAAILQLADDDLASCSWGLTLASMAHETQYSRLFRS